MRGDLQAQSQFSPSTQATKRNLACTALLLATMLAACNSDSLNDESDSKEDETPKAEIDPVEDTRPDIDWSLLTPQAGDITDLVYNANGQWSVSDLHNAWDGNWAPGNGSLQDDTRQPHNNFVFHFGKVVAERDSSRVIGYVVASAPGKGIAHWDRDAEFFYEVRDVALNALNAQGVKSEFDAVLWHQGETDWQARGTSDPQIFGDERNNPTYYRDKLYSLIADFRGQSWINDNAYFICGETAIAPVNEVMMELNNDNDERTGCVSAEGLTTLTADPVPVHFDAAGLRELGKRYAELYLSMTE